MNGDELEKKLDMTFAQNLKVDISSGFKNDVDMFKKKVILLENTGRHKGLIKSLLRSKER